MENEKPKEQKKNDEISMNFFKRLKISIINFEQYHIIAADGWKKALTYMIKLVLLFSLIITIATSYKINTIIQDICKYTQTEIPDFKIENNEFTISSETPVVINDNQINKIKIILKNDDDISKELIAFDNNKTNLIIVTKNYIYVDAMSGKVKYSIADLCNSFNIETLTKNQLISELQSNKLFYIMYIYVFIVLFFIYFVSILIDVMALSFVGYLVSRMIGLPLKYGAVFSIAVSAMTLSIVLNVAYILANMFFGFTIKYFQVMYTIISYIYLLFSVFLMKSNLLKIKTKKVFNNEKNSETGEENN